MTVTKPEETALVARIDLDATAPAADPTTPLVTADLLVEDVSIDGMCGVY